MDLVTRVALTLSWLFTRSSKFIWSPEDSIEISKKNLSPGQRRPTTLPASGDRSLTRHNETNNSTRIHSLSYWTEAQPSNALGRMREHNSLLGRNISVPCKPRSLTAFSSRDAGAKQCRCVLVSVTMTEVFELRELSPFNFFQNDHSVAQTDGRDWDVAHFVGRGATAM